MDMSLDGIAKVFDRVTRETGTEIETISRDRSGKGDVPFVVIDEGRKVYSAKQIVEEFETTQPKPYRRKGTYAAASVKSLLDWMKAETPDDAPVFGVGLEKLNGEWRNPKLSLVGIGNYSSKAEGEWHDFNCRYAFPVSTAWTVWAAGHSDDDKPKWIPQADFAEFIESRIHDLSSPKGSEKLGEAVNRFIEASGKDLDASPSEMFRISRELKILSSEKIETKIDLQSGETRLQYSQEHTGPGGRPVKIPALFWIRIPVFFGQAPVLIGVKLRHRAGGGSVSWAYSLFAPDLVVAEEFEKACDDVRKSKRPLYLGAPDRLTLPGAQGA